MPVAELSEPELLAWGERFGATLALPACVSIRGDLGAGKTTLVQAIARGLGVTDAVTSPTYALVHEYASKGAPVAHVDLYRLDRPEQLPQIGWDELLATKGTLLVEWPERAPDAFPAHTVRLALEHVPGRSDARRLTWPG